MFLKNMFRKKKEKPSEAISRRGKIVSKIIDLTIERKELKDKLNELQNEILADIKKEIGSVLKEVEVVKSALSINDRKIQDTVIFLEEELTVEDNGMYV